MYSQAVYAGSFDPVTNGHLDIIRRARNILGQVTVVVIPNGNKACLFSPQERVMLLKEALAGEPGVQIDCVSGGLLTEYLRKKGCSLLIRGIRAAADVEHELTNAYYNKLFLSSCETLLLPGDPALSFVSSSSVREAARYGGDVSSLVPPGVVRALQEKFSTKK